MRVVVAGGHGKIALRLERLLSARADQVVGLIRDPGQSDDLAQVGAEAQVVDLENSTAEQIANHLRGATAVVFAAGAGPGSGAARKETVDHGAAVLLADAAARAGVRRYVLVSAMGVDSEPRQDTDEVFAAYLRAKRAAERDLADRDLDLTVLRPGLLTNDAGSGQVTLAPSVERAEVTRDDVALVLLALLDEPNTIGLTLELINGDAAVDVAVASVAGGA